jgi:hypothetical protein
VLLDAHILGIEMPQERLIRSILADYEGWQVRHRVCLAGTPPPLGGLLVPLPHNMSIR